MKCRLKKFLSHDKKPVFFFSCTLLTTRSLDYGIRQRTLHIYEPHHPHSVIEYWLSRQESFESENHIPKFSLNMASFPNVYTHRKVADTASKACEICYKPTTSVLVTPENKVGRDSLAHLLAEFIFT